MEGIYITDNSNETHTGFVVYYERGNYAISKFTSCTLPFIREHAKAKYLVDPKIFYTIPVIDSEEVKKTFE